MSIQPGAPTTNDSFTSSAGAVLAWVEVETEESFVLGPERPGQSSEGDVIVLGREGDTLLF